MNKISKVDLAYLAGLVDGEGTVTISRRNRNEFRSPDVSIASCSRELVEEALRITGVGYISSKRTYQANHSPSFAWRVKGSDALRVLDLLAGTLREKIKAKRARKLLDEYQLVTQRNGKYSEDQRAKKMQFEDEFLSLKR